MAKIGIIGEGDMGQAISSVVTKGGNEVELYGQDDADKPVSGDIVILAVPYPRPARDHRGPRRAARRENRRRHTNPINFETYDSLTVAPDSSAAAELSAALPDSRVIKAFNTTFAATLTSGTVGGKVTTVLMAGDDTDAKRALADVVTAGGLRRSIRVAFPVPGSWKPSGSCKSRSRRVRRFLGREASPSSPDHTFTRKPSFVRSDSEQPSGVFAIRGLLI